MVYPEPCKELRRQNSATISGCDCPLLTFIDHRVLIAAHLVHLRHDFSSQRPPRPFLPARQAADSSAEVSWGPLVWQWSGMKGCSGERGEQLTLGMMCCLPHMFSYSLEWIGQTKSRNCSLATKMVLQKSMKSRNSGSVALSHPLIFEGWILLHDTGELGLLYSKETSFGPLIWAPGSWASFGSRLLGAGVLR